MKVWKRRTYEKDEHLIPKCNVARRLNQNDIDFEKSSWAKKTMLEATLVTIAGLGWKQCPKCGTWNADDWPEWGGCQMCWEGFNGKAWHRIGKYVNVVDYSDIPF